MPKDGIPFSRTLDSAIDATGKGGFWKFVASLNSLLNPGHAWADYSSKPESQLESWMHRQSGVSLTGAEREANAFTAAEAQKQRDWESEMSNTSYQRQVADMRAAGVNPAMAMSGSAGASTPSGASAASVAPSGAGLSMSDLMQLLMAPLQAKLMKSQAQQARDQGKAALINAGANVTNAETGQGNLDVNRQNAETARFRAETERMAAEVENELRRSHIRVNDEDVKRIAAQTAFINLQREQLPAQLAIAQKNADSQAKSAMASLRQADAAVQNAATNDRLSDYETSLKYAQEMLTWYQADGQKVIAQFLPERARAEIDNLIKEGVVMDARGRLINKQGHLVDAQTVKTYVNVGTDISGAVNQWLNPLSKGAAGSNGAGFDLTGAYQGVAYGYD